MNHKLLAILAGTSLFCCAPSTQATTVVMFKGYSTTSGEYNEFETRGYDIQPNRPGVWVNGCRTDNYYCMAQLERCNVYEGTRYTPPIHLARPPEGVVFKEPSLLKEHR